MTQLATPTVQPETHSEETGPLARVIRLDWERALYVVLILLAVITRFWALGDRVVSHDESLHTQYAYQYYIGDGYQHTPLMHGPFLFHITAVTYWLFGEANDFTARIPVAILGVILVGMPYLLRDWLGRRGALFTSFLFLISPYLLYYARYIRHDMPVIVWSMIAFIAIWHYLRRPDRDRYLWWFAAGTALMFSTKEVAFIYVAIFGSFLVIMLAARLWTSDWVRPLLPSLRLPLAMVLLAAVLVGAGLSGQRARERQQAEASATVTATSEGFAADPDETLTPTAPATAETSLFHVIQLLGVGALAAGLFLGASRLRPRLDGYPEFDLIALYVSLLLPLVSAFLIVMAGWDPRDYTINRCFPEGSEGMGAVSLLFARLTDATCWNAYFTAPAFRSGAFLVFALIIGILVGLWWNRRRFIVPAAIFHAIFLVLYTSVFTNPGGWTSGMLGSLGYWLAQQEVARGGQPWFYYLFVTPLYEFLPLSLTLLAAWHWFRQKRLHRVLGYWFLAALIALLLYSFVNWRANLPVALGGAEPSRLSGLIAAAALLVVASVAWFALVARRLKTSLGLIRGWRDLPWAEAMTGFVPFLLFWFVMTYVAYSVAGEKMPWLSTHFVIPMGLLGGWYVNERLRGFALRRLSEPRTVILLVLSLALVVAVFVALRPLFLGEVQIGAQQQDSLQRLGRFLGSATLVVGLAYLWRRSREQVGAAVGSRIWLATGLILLSLATVRFSLMASFPNGDFATEFLVYAHGAPATKDTVMSQVDELSLRLHGDNSLKVAFDDISSWPYLWYLRDYPNRLYFGGTPARNVTEYPVIIAGDNNWTKVDQLIGNDYEYSTHTFIWWPMEEYRKIGWSAILGDPQAAPETRRGLGTANVRRALWDIFWHRDYRRYGQVFGGSYADSQWPLRRPLRLYVGKDVYTQLWDYGATAATFEPAVDPYAEGALTPQAVQLYGGAGELLTPRNVAIGPDGRIYVADAGNHRIAVFDGDGDLEDTWGGFGADAGLFNEPWGIAADGAYVYVADTWNHRVQKFTLDGELVRVIGQAGAATDAGSGGGLFFGPRAILLVGDDRFLVTDTGNHRIQMFDRDGNFVQQIGGQGGTLGQMYEPVGMAEGSDGSLFLADTWNGRIQRFSSDLFPLGDWSVDAWRGESINNKPYLAASADGRIYVTDPEGYRVLVFNEGGLYLGRFGQFGAELSSFGLPNGIAVNAEGDVFVADAGNNRVMRFAAADLAFSATGPAGAGGGN